MTPESELALDREAFARLGDAQAHAQLQAFARSTTIGIDRNEWRMLLCGTDLAHHEADPYLHENADALPVRVRREEHAGFHRSLPDYDLCLEDSWSGYFVARHVTTHASTEPLVFVHLDDHTDMMSTLLTLAPNGLRDPASGARFDPRQPDDWSSAIRSGAIGIGSFVTALYYLPQPVHVVHLDHVTHSLYERYPVTRRSIAHPLLPHARFAAIHKRTRASSDQLGTYTHGCDPAHLLRAMPAGRLIVHIDLDYFINDYNGNAGAKPRCTVEQMRARAGEAMQTFFDEITRTGRTVERWIVATSPGFCSARHWNWLLDEIRRHIVTLKLRFSDTPFASDQPIR
ncbi:hypothetical protein [Caballeronia telluris]|uniref:Uncharacterized protein n=1 Tax=Caballeronia telluris TaxID=326475 RepID=A0A158KBL0_9BURK|nr:hypothetical protein [Caballeronia telluris]SAL78516.1 hypothetical protein AWB66_05859 [Caballeronia telluris]